MIATLKETPTSFELCLSPQGQDEMLTLARLGLLGSPAALTQTFVEDKGIRTFVTITKLDTRSVVGMPKSR